MTAINPDLVRKHHENGDFESLLSLFNTLKDQRDRAEFQNTVYLHEIKRLAIAFANVTEPATGLRVSEQGGVTRSRDSIGARPKPATKPPVESLEL